jgi:hypothetical protein
MMKYFIVKNNGILHLLLVWIIVSALLVLLTIVSSLCVVLTLVLGPFVVLWYGARPQYYRI